MFRVIHIDGVKTNYAINEEGTIININTGCALHPNKLDRLHRYRRVHLTINGEGLFLFCAQACHGNIQANKQPRGNASKSY